MSKTQVAKLEESWRKCLKAYKTLKKAHAEFCEAAEGIDQDHAGSGLRTAMQLLFHRRRFSMFMEDLLYEDFRKGGTDRLEVPTDSSNGDEEQVENTKKVLKTKGK